jgi:hypothetical protein
MCFNCKISFLTHLFFWQIICHPAVISHWPRGLFPKDACSRIKTCGGQYAFPAPSSAGPRNNWLILNLCEWNLWSWNLLKSGFTTSWTHFKYSLCANSCLQRQTLTFALKTERQNNRLILRSETEYLRRVWGFKVWILKLAVLSALFSTNPDCSWTFCNFNF